MAFAVAYEGPKRNLGTEQSVAGLLVLGFEGGLGEPATKPPSFRDGRRLGEVEKRRQAFNSERSRWFLSVLRTLDLPVAAGAPGSKIGTPPKQRPVL